MANTVPNHDSNKPSNPNNNSKYNKFKKQTKESKKASQQEDSSESNEIAQEYSNMSQEDELDQHISNLEKIPAISLGYQDLSLQELKSKFQAKLESVQVNRKATVKPKPSESKSVKKQNNRINAPQAVETVKISEDAKMNVDETHSQEESEIESEIEEDFQFNNVLAKGEDSIRKELDDKVKGFGRKKSKKQLLRELESKEKRIENMPAEKREKKLQKQALKTALLRAQGVKVLDNASLLRKSIGGDERKKQKSAVAWKERAEEALKEKEKSLEEDAPTGEKKKSKSKGSQKKN
jgi:hypothetical protein